MSELDEIGDEFSKAFKQMVQMAILIQNRARTAGHREATERAARTMEAREQVRETRLREAAHNKALDPRNRELERVIERNVHERPTVDLTRHRERTPVADPVRERGPERIRNTEAGRTLAWMSINAMTDDPALAQVAWLHHLGNAQSAADAVRDREREAAARRAREAEHTRERERLRERAATNGHSRERGR